MTTAPAARRPARKKTPAPPQAASAPTPPPTHTPQGARVIKKYPNRRLYDTASSSYVTLAQVKALVMQAEPFAVCDAKTGEDLTRSILLQIILEEEAGGSPIFTETVLAHIIRSYGHAMQGFFGATLEGQIQAFADMQKKMLDMAPQPWPNMLAAMPAQKMVQDMMQGYADQSRNAMQHMHEQMQRHYQTQMQQWLAAFQPPARKKP